MKNQLVLPMGVYVLYIWCLAVYMFRSRVHAIKANHGLMKYFKTHSGDTLPERTIVIGRHFDNQFQVPMLFLITCLVHLSLGFSNLTTNILAWIFVISRFFHAWIHLGSNRIQLRVIFYTLGWIAVLLLWAQIIYFSF